MRVMLLDPGPAVTDAFMAVQYFKLPPAGLPYLAALLEEAGHEVTIISVPQRFGFHTDDDSYWRRLATINDFLARVEPDVLGVSIVSGEAYMGAMDMIRAYKEARPGRRVVAGGPHASAVWRDMLEDEPSIDAVVIGEGEETLPELLQAFQSGKDLREVHGIGFRDNGRIEATGSRPPARNLGRYPLPVFHALDYSERYAVVPIFSSRGCPFKCEFCAEYLMSHGLWRSYGPERVLQMMDAGLRVISARVVAFLDPIFGVNKPEMMSLLNRISDRWPEGPPVWSAQMRIDTLETGDLDVFGSSGALSFSFGLESGSPRMLRIMNKSASAEEYLDTYIRKIKLLAQLDILMEFNVMLGFPGENHESLMETLEFAQRLKEIRPDKIIFRFPIYTPYPGTSSYLKSDQYTRTFGTRFKNMSWWKQRIGSPGSARQFLVDPSKDLTAEDLKEVKSTFQGLLGSTRVHDGQFFLDLVRKRDNTDLASTGLLTYQDYEKIIPDWSHLMMGLLTGQ
ncbi:MAG: B12-binding domain-containing radical SAM protein [Deltaproteobacteria bacterium]|nr:B12-binding domain-containing radical SAM protein [Deltaproteobacteria bacterium]MBW2137418.1 B12-binding domain-containing radical SAM protein [Deltaproteobacteria bacterium]